MCFVRILEYLNLAFVLIYWLLEQEYGIIIVISLPMLQVFGMVWPVWDI